MNYDGIVSLDKAKEVLNGGVSKAQELMKDPAKIDGLLVQLEEKLKTVPAVGDMLADLPLMVAMIKSYISKEYTASPKVIALMVSAVIYVVTGKDLIPDRIPILGQLDDIAVIAVCLNLNKPELNAYREWRDAGKPVEVTAEAVSEE